MNILATENGIQSRYKINNPVDFFTSINDWLDIEGEQEALVRMITRPDGVMFLVDGCDDDKKVLGIDNEVVMFNSEDEVFSIIKEFVNKSDQVDLLKPRVIH